MSSSISSKRINRYQIIASVIIIIIALIFVYAYILYPKLYPLKQDTVLNNKLIVIGPHNYKAIPFNISDTFGREAIIAQFQVLNNNSTIGVGNNEEMRNGGSNAFVADSLDRFECKRQQHFVSPSRLDASNADSVSNNNCSLLATTVKYQILDATVGSIDQTIRYGNYFLVFDNIDSNTPLQIKANLSTFTDMPLTFPPTSDD
ncbi:MAG: hypothetical protein ACJ71B_05860 [Nitrososphaera sp.]